MPQFFGSSKPSAVNDNEVQRLNVDGTFLTSSIAQIDRRREQKFSSVAADDHPKAALNGATTSRMVRTALSIGGINMAVVGAGMLSATIAHVVMPTLIGVEAIGSILLARQAMAFSKRLDALNERRTLQNTSVSPEYPSGPSVPFKR